MPLLAECGMDLLIVFLLGPCWKRVGAIEQMQITQSVVHASTFLLFKQQNTCKYFTSDESAGDGKMCLQMLSDIPFPRTLC